MPVFTTSFCAVIVAIYILDTFFLIPESVPVSWKEKLFSGHNKGRLNRALHLSERKIKKGEVWRLISSALLHVGTPHILTNTTAMLIVGYAVETRLGPGKTLPCYFVSTLVSGLFMAFFYKLQEGEGIGSAGDPAAVSGSAARQTQQPQNEIRFDLPLFADRRRPAAWRRDRG